MNEANKIANNEWEDGACATTATHSRHGLSKGMRRNKRKRNKSARKKATMLAFKREDY